MLAKITLWLPCAITVLGDLRRRRWLGVPQAGARRRAARGLEKALLQQAKEQARVVRPDLQIEVQQMQDEFDKAVGALKGSKLGANGRDALYPLPWYAIIGPPGAGKSTALRNSGLQFPYLPAGRGSGQGHRRHAQLRLVDDQRGGHRSTPPAAGPPRKTTTTSGWRSSALLKKYRPQEAAQRPDHRDQRRRRRSTPTRTRSTRWRCASASAWTRCKHTRVSVPVYVLFTKCDLVAGLRRDVRRSARTEREADVGLHRCRSPSQDRRTGRVLRVSASTSWPTCSSGARSRAWATSGGSIARRRSTRSPSSSSCCADNLSKLHRHGVHGQHLPRDADVARRVLHERHPRGPAVRPV